MNDQNFADLGLAEPLLRALSAKNYVTPTPIQARAIPELMTGRDMLGIAQTGTGKTAAFGLPILHHLSKAGTARAPRALILAPTRELAIQIGDELRAYGEFLRLRHTVIFGGVTQGRQVKALASGVDIVVATPGRLIDLLGQGRLNLKSVEFLVLDEADRMLDMGFVRDVRKIVAALPRERQSLLFSATMPREIARLSADILTDPIRVEVTPQATPVDRIDQSVRHVDAAGKRALLADILKDRELSRVIVFTRTKHRANRVAEYLAKDGITADAIHGNKSQGARQRALKRFSSGDVRVLVATDIAARGIDIDDISHVVNFELPNEPESYVHRIGRTARAGALGAAISFCDTTERAYLRDIERLIERRLTVVGPEPAPAATHEPAKGARRAKGARPAKGARHATDARPAKPRRRRPRRRNTAANGRNAGAAAAI